MGAPDKGVNEGLAAAFGELQAGPRAVPLVEHEGHLGCYGAVCRKAAEQEAQQVQPVARKLVLHCAVNHLRQPCAYPPLLTPSRPRPGNYLQAVGCGLAGTADCSQTCQGSTDLGEGPRELQSRRACCQEGWEVAGSHCQSCSRIKPDGCGRHRCRRPGQGLHQHLRPPAPA